MLNKYLIALLTLHCSFVHALGTSDKVLKQKGYAVANYQVCEWLAQNNEDAVMALYYSEMLQDDILDKEKLSRDEQIFFDNERQKAVLILKEINSASMFKLCQNRFNTASRQYYETKLKTLKNK